MIAMIRINRGGAELSLLFLSGVLPYKACYIIKTRRDCERYLFSFESEIITEFLLG